MLSESKSSEKIILTDDHSYKLAKDNGNGSSVHGNNNGNNVSKPFQIVLVDIKKAAIEEEIYCVEKTLDDKDLKFVALTYRSGDLQETVIDTQLDYLARNTSFHLRDFYTLCKRMAMEQDLKSIDYVWVDVICVDQTNSERRNETFNRMTEIYEKASYIIAVPDLHLSHLKDINTKADQIISGTIGNRQYIYHLIHENMDELVKIDEQWLNTIGVPKDPGLRQKLAKHTAHVGDGLQKRYPAAAASHQGHILDNGILHTHMHDSIKTSTSKEFTSHEKNGRLQFNWDDHLEAMQNSEWTRLIAERTESIRQSMDFLRDLVKEWSSRVWAINEYNMAKNKSRIMKYWFIQLQDPLVSGPNQPFRFFEFDFDDVSFSLNSHGGGGEKHGNCIFKPGSSHHALATRSDFIYQNFRNTMRRQLNQQTFLEMMLKSKASTNENRFYAILPLSEYKNKFATLGKVNHRDGGLGKGSNIISVKLKIYELVNTKDKLELLFLSSYPTSKLMVLPTFASSQIKWPTTEESVMLENEPCTCNFDLTNNDSIMLIPLHIHRDDDDENDDHHHSVRWYPYKLNIKPCEYYTCDDSAFAKAILEKNKTVCAKLGMYDLEERFEMVCVPSYRDTEIHASSTSRPNGNAGSRQLFLVGSFAKNKWLITAKLRFPSTDHAPGWTSRYSNDDDVGFDIY